MQNGLAQNPSLIRATTEQRSPADETPPSRLLTPKKKLRNKNSSVEFFFSIGLVGLGLVIFILGNKYWSDRYYHPEEGLGYFLGLTGGILMLLAFGYSVLKHTIFIKYVTLNKFWLKMHLICGIIGPFLILFHSTFRIGSINGGFALISMISMFITGVLARYIYPKTHINLSAKKRRVFHLKRELKLVGRTIQSRQLDLFTDSVLMSSPNFISAFWLALSYNWRSRLLYIRLSHDIHKNLMIIAKQQVWEYSTFCRQKRQLKQKLRDYIVILKKVALLRFYAQFFFFWRAVHIPLSLLLLMSGVVHVVAVHMF